MRALCRVSCAACACLLLLPLLAGCGRSDQEAGIAKPRTGDKINPDAKWITDQNVGGSGGGR